CGIFRRSNTPVAWSRANTRLLRDHARRGNSTTLELSHRSELPNSEEIPMLRFFRRRRTLILVVTTILCASSRAEAQSCRSQGIAVQVLGSGGPELQDKRASSSYLLWQDGRARVVLDA